MTYGLGQPPGRFVPYVIRSLQSGEPPRLSDGSMQADWIYVDGMTDGLLAALVVPGIEGLSIDLGSGRTASVREVVERLVLITGASVTPLFGERANRPGELVRAGRREPGR